MPAKWTNKRTLLAAGCLLMAIVLAVVLSKTVFRTADVTSSPDNGIELSTPTASTSSVNPSPSPAQDACHDTRLVTPPEDTAEKLEKIAADHGVTMEAAWYDPEKGVVRVGEKNGLPAWSTIKVPIALAIAQQGKGDEMAGAISASLHDSDNDTAAQLWSALSGSQFERAQIVDDLFVSVGDKTTKIDGQGYFGLTLWDVADQVTFLKQMPCVSGADQIIGDMSNIREDLRWGIGQLPNPVFKGGWGLDNGVYTSRQLGWFTTEDGDRVLLAIALSCPDHETGSKALTEMAKAFAKDS